MKKFRFYYTPLVKILIFAVIVIAAAGVAFNVITVINYAKTGGFYAAAYGVLCVLTAVLFAEAVAIAFYGLYKIKDGCLYSCFGFIYSKTDLKEIVAVHVFANTEKLVLYYKNEKYSVIIIPPELYDEFIAELLKNNPEIAYDANIGETA